MKRSKYKHKLEEGKGFSYNFSQFLQYLPVEGDYCVKRTILHTGIGKASYGLIAKLFDVSPSTVHRWLKSKAARVPEPEIPETIRKIEFDEISSQKGGDTEGGCYDGVMVCFDDP